MSDWTSFISGVFDRAAETYDSLGIDFFGPAGTALVAEAGVLAEQSVLDVGCGRGASLVPAAQAVGTTGSVTGIDIAPAMVAYVNAKLASLGLSQGRAMIGDAGNPEFPPESFDVILAGFVIFFLREPDAALQRYAGLLRPGGRLVMTVKPEDIPAHAVIKNGVDMALAQYIPASRLPPGAPKPTALNSRESLGILLARSGLTSVRFVDQAYRVEFESPDHYWRWMWSHGARGTLEEIPDEHLGSARSAVIEALTPCLNAHGQLECPMPVRFVVASTPTMAGG